MRGISLTLVALVASLAVSGCRRAGFDPVVTPGTHTDVDAAVDLADATDATTDLRTNPPPETGGETGTDVGVDSDSDAPGDAGSDAGVDGSSDSGFDASGDSGVDGSSDSGVDASSDGSADAACRRFGPPRLLELNTVDEEFDPALTEDQRLIVFVRDVLGGDYLFEATRADATGPFGPPRRLTEIGGGGRVSVLSGDGLALFFSAGGACTSATRASRTSLWSGVQRHFEVEWISATHGWAFVKDGLGLVISSSVMLDGTTNYLTTRTQTTDLFPRPVTTSGFGLVPRADPFLTYDGLELWGTDRGDGRVYRVTRRSTAEAFAGLEDVSALFTGTLPTEIELSSDGLTAYYVLHDEPGGAGGADIWVATRGCR